MSAALLHSAADEVHFARTADGWRLALHRHRPRGGIGGPPVIVCGGYACNRHFVDYDERYSLARYLARTGFDAWVLELRGRGLSHHDARDHRWSWTFDDLVDHDVPAAVDYVAAATGQALAWVGHSMGGMVLYAYLGRHAARASAVRAGVTIASPLVFPRAASELLNTIGRLLVGLPFLDLVPQRMVLTTLWSLMRRSSAVWVGMNPDNVDRTMIGDALGRFISNVPRAKLEQLARWATDGAFCSVDGRTDYRAALRRVTTPLLVMAGSADRLATPEAVRLALYHLVAAPTAYREFGRAQGQRTDYGHVDLILGQRAPDEVFPAVAAWLVPQAAEGAWAHGALAR